MSVLREIKVGLNSKRHPEYLADLTGAAERLGIRPGYYDQADNCVYLDIPAGSRTNWTSAEDVIVTLPDGSEWACWVEVSE